jgi:hypothetical protein
MTKLMIDRDFVDCYKHVVNRTRERDNGVSGPGFGKDNDVLLVHGGPEGRFFLPGRPSGHALH